MSMIQFLKDSTFGVSDVIRKSWHVLRSRYFSIAGFCLSLFITSNTSGILAFYMQDVNPVLSAFMAFLFVVIYFGIQLTLFKFVLKLIDGNERPAIWETIPSKLELSRFFMAMLSVGGVMLASFLLAAVIAWPFIYLVGVDAVTNGLFLSAAALFLYMLIRVAFYPFFVLDKNMRAWQSIRMSFALTRGNVVKVLLILAFFAFLQLLFIYFNYLGYPVVSTILSMLSSFFVVPLSSVVVVVAYRDMVKGEVKNEDHA